MYHSIYCFLQSTTNASQCQHCALQRFTAISQGSSEILCLNAKKEVAPNFFIWGGAPNFGSYIV